VVTMTMLYQIVPPGEDRRGDGHLRPRRRRRPGVGPTLGGYLVEYVDWRLIFFINVPIGILGTIAALVVFPRIHPTTWPKFDLWGFVTIAYGLFALLLAFSEGQDWGWTGYRDPGPVRLRGAQPRAVRGDRARGGQPADRPADLQGLGVRRTRCCCSASAMTGLFATLYFMPQFLQVGAGYAGAGRRPGAAALGLVLVVLMPVAGRIYDMIGPRWPVALGLAVMAYGSYLLAGITPDTPRPTSSCGPRSATSAPGCP
jgi:MFS family permease